MRKGPNTRRDAKRHGLGTLSMREWAESMLRAEEFAPLWRWRGRECTQRAGEVMYVPANLNHGVLNYAVRRGLTWLGSA
jgi:hypothetical protein